MTAQADDAAPLRRTTVVITRPAGQAASLAALLRARESVAPVARAESASGREGDAPTLAAAGRGPESRGPESRGPEIRRTEIPDPEILIYPAIAIAPVADAGPLDAALAALETYRLVVFVSPNAIDHALARLAKPWPASVEIAVVGPGSVAALASHGIGAPHHRVHAPPGHEAVDNPRFDSEALLEQLQALRLTGARVLIVKGNGGRPWLAEQLQARGAAIDLVESYRRAMPEHGTEIQATMQALIAAAAPAAFIVTSSEGLSNLLLAVERLAGRQGLDWLRASTLLVPHARIAENATAAGFARIVLTGPGDENIARGVKCMGF